MFLDTELYPESLDDELEDLRWWCAHRPLRKLAIDFDITYTGFYFYRGRIDHCSEQTTEAELYCADCYGSGSTLLYLDNLGNYVGKEDCLMIHPSFLIRLLAALPLVFLDIQGFCFIPDEI
jgi:hypothetical protein